MTRSGRTISSRRRRHSRWCRVCTPRLNQPKSFAPPGLFVRLEDGGAEGWCQDDGDEHREHHGRDDGDRELPVDDAHRAAKERHRDENGGQHKGYADEGAGDLVHRFLGGLARRQALIGHDALDVFDHDDGVVDEEADRQDRGEHGEHIDRIAERGENAEGAEQHHRHGDHRDQRGAEILEEDQQHHEDQHDGFDQRLDHLFDRLLDEGRRLVGIGDGDAGRQDVGQAIERGVHAIGGRDGVGAARQLDAEAGGGMAVVGRTLAIGGEPELDA